MLFEFNYIPSAKAGGWGLVPLAEVLAALQLLVQLAACGVLKDEKHTSLFEARVRQHYVRGSSI